MTSCCFHHAFMYPSTWKGIMREQTLAKPPYVYTPEYIFEAATVLEVVLLQSDACPKPLLLCCVCMIREIPYAHVELLSDDAGLLHKQTTLHTCLHVLIYVYCRYFCFRKLTERTRNTSTNQRAVAPTITYSRKG